MKQLKKRGLFVAAVIAIMLAMPLTSCVTSQKVVEKTILPPEVEFPLPPEPEGVEISSDGKIVFVPVDTWLAIADYYIDVEATRKKYLKIREEYKE